MILIRSRFVALEPEISGEAPIVKAERYALQVRKIVEGVAYGALSAVEHRNAQVLREQRTKDADKLLTWLDQKSLLRLPSAQRIKPPISEDHKFVLEGAGSEDWTLDMLKQAYSRASALVHERHPEQLENNDIRNELDALVQDATKLRSWLWLHMMFLKGEAFYVQMGQFGTPSFITSLTRLADVPESLRE